MSASEAVAPSTVQPSARSRLGGRVTFARVLHAEWIKFWSLRSTWWILGATTAVTIGFAALSGVALRAANTIANNANAANSPQGNGQMRAQLSTALSQVYSTDVLQMGAIIGQVVIAILGILLITNEYSSGMIRATLAAVPRRTSVLWSKALAVGVVAFLLSFVASWIGLLVASPLVSSFAQHNEFSVQALHVTAGIGLVTALIVIFALAVGALLRNGGGAIGVVLGIMFVLTILLQELPWQWSKDLGQYLPNVAGSNIFSLSIDTTQALPFWSSLFVTLAWAFIPLIVATVLLKK
ncbi:MAG: ABC transporter permease, partial [Micrococcales bacterium]|nr:ABC transporter permease [Micrococcales bacterium]